MHVKQVNNTKVRKYCIQFLVFFPAHTVLTLSPQPFTLPLINFSHKVSFLPPSGVSSSLRFKKSVEENFTENLFNYTHLKYIQSII